MKSWFAYLLLCLGSLALLMHGILPHHHHEGGVLNEHAHHFSHAGDADASHAHAHAAHVEAEAQADAPGHVLGAHAAHGHEQTHDAHEHAHDGHQHTQEAPEAVELEDLGLTGHLHAAEDAHDQGLEHGFHSFEIPIRGKVLDLDPGLSTPMLALLSSLVLPGPLVEMRGLRAPPAPPPNSQTYPASVGLRGPPVPIA